MELDPLALTDDDDAGVADRVELAVAVRVAFSAW
jgi:hypothetical protein